HFIGQFALQGSQQIKRLGAFGARDGSGESLKRGKSCGAEVAQMDQFEMRPLAAGLGAMVDVVVGDESVKVQEAADIEHNGSCENVDAHKPLVVLAEGDSPDD